MCRIQKEREEYGSPTLGIFRPHGIERLLIEPTETNWKTAQLGTLSQDTLFEKAPKRSKRYHSTFVMNFVAAMLIVTGTR
jgi:hypothetical protein